MIRKILKLAMTSAVMLLLASMLVSAPASAHQTEVSQGNDFAVTDSNHRSGSVCDMERDGHFVSARWVDAEGFTVGYEEDGGDSGCDQVSFKGEAETVTVCELAIGVLECTDPHKV